MKGAIVTQDGKGSQWEFLSVSFLLMFLDTYQSLLQKLKISILTPIL